MGFLKYQAVTDMPDPKWWFLEEVISALLVHPRAEN